MGLGERAEASPINANDSCSVSTATPEGASATRSSRSGAPRGGRAPNPFLFLKPGFWFQPVGRLPRAGTARQMIGWSTRASARWMLPDSPASRGQPEPAAGLPPLWARRQRGKICHSPLDAHALPLLPEWQPPSSAPPRNAQWTSPEFIAGDRSFSPFRGVGGHAAPSHPFARRVS
jgi:hypothetical protein